MEGEEKDRGKCAMIGCTGVAAFRPSVILPEGLGTLEINLTFCTMHSMDDGIPRYIIETDEVRSMLREILPGRLPPTASVTVVWERVPIVLTRGMPN